MSDVSRIVVRPRPAISPEDARDARARALRYALDRFFERQRVAKTGSDEGYTRKEQHACGTGHFDNNDEPEQLCLWDQEELAKYQQPSVPQLPPSSGITLSFEAEGDRTTHLQDVEERVANSDGAIQPMLPGLAVSATAFLEE